MSRWARWTIGIAAALGGSSLLFTAPRPMNPWGAAIIIVAFGLVLVACFSDVGRPVAVRIIGGAVSFTYFCFLVVSLSPGYSRRLGVDVEGESWKMLVRAVMGFLLWGLPGLYVMITGKFPWWWRKPPKNNAEYK